MGIVVLLIAVLLGATAFIPPVFSIQHVIITCTDYKVLRSLPDGKLEILCLGSDIQDICPPPLVNPPTVEPTENPYPVPKPVRKIFRNFD